MKKLNQDLITISRKVGQNPDYVLAGGGNTSFKDDTHIWIKASGSALADIDESGFVCLSREKLKTILTGTYSHDPLERERQVKDDLSKAIVEPQDKRPSVETSLHEAIRFPFIVHTHPTLVNGLLCACNSREKVNELFGDSVLYIEYTDPGYMLFKTVEKALERFRKENATEPEIVFLENHGIFFGADTTEYIESINRRVENTLEAITGAIPSGKSVADPLQLARIAAEIERYSKYDLKCLSYADELTDQYVKDTVQFSKIQTPFTPDMVVYCKSNYVFVDHVTEIPFSLNTFRSVFGYLPKVILVGGMGIFALEENEKSAKVVLDVYLNLIRISYLSEFFGGPRPLTQAQINFIDTWEVENYRRKISKTSGSE